MLKNSFIIISLAAVYTLMLFILLFIPQSGNADLRDSEKLSKGLNIWRSHNCSVCHSLYGLGGHMGPDLTNVVSRRGKEYVRHIVLNGGEIMPGFDIKRDGMDRLVSYLEELDSSGKYPPESREASGFGAF